MQAEKLRSKAQRPETTRSTPQLCRYLLYLGRIRAIQLEYTDAKDCLQQAARKACSPVHRLLTYMMVHQGLGCTVRRCFAYACCFPVPCEFDLAWCW